MESWPPQWFVSTPKRSAGGHALYPDEARLMAEKVLGQVPITRIHDLRPLGIIDAHVWAAVTPLARDLTVHLGKGESSEQAWLSAAFEAIERLSAEQVERPTTSWPEGDEADRRDVIQDLGLGEFQKELLTNSWWPVWDLVGECPAELPEAVLASPSPMGGEVRANTNGLASGGTRLEAVLHAVYELIERDATTNMEALLSYSREAHWPRPRHLPQLSSAMSKLLTDIEACGMSLRVVYPESIGGIPVCAAYLRDESFPGFEGEDLLLMGAGASMDVSHATSRAITEACQAHSGLFLGSRENFEGLNDQDQLPCERSEFLIRRAKMLAQPLASAYEPQEDFFDDILAELSHLIDLLRRNGIKHVFVADLTHSDWGVPVVRVVIPQLALPGGSWVSTPPRRLLMNLIAP